MQRRSFTRTGPLTTSHGKGDVLRLAGGIKAANMGAVLEIPMVVA